jgi:hypothetical protein
LNARWGKSVQRLLRWGFPALLLAVLGYSLTRLGWAHIWTARPVAPGFYFVILLQFFIQPVADFIVYRNLLGVGQALPFSIILRKRFINDMLDYSGEFYFFLWARKNLSLKKGLLLHAVKDSNILSASAGLTMVWLMLLALTSSGLAKLPALMHGSIGIFASIGSLPLVLGLALFIGGRKVTALSRKDIAITFSVHLARCVANLSTEFAIWWFSGALPSAAICLLFVALRVLVTRLPFMVNKDLVFIGMGMATAGLMDLSAPNIAAVLMLMTAIGLLENLALVGLPWLLELFQVRRNADQLIS